MRTTRADSGARLLRALSSRDLDGGGQDDDAAMGVVGHPTGGASGGVAVMPRSDSMRKRAWTMPTHPASTLWAPGPGPGTKPSTLDWANQSPENNAFLRGFRPALTVAQVFGLLPVSTPSDARRAAFRWRSPRTTLAVVIIMAASASSVLMLLRMVETGVKYYTSVNAVFFILTTTAQVLFLRMSRGWPELMQDIAKVEGSAARVYGQPAHLRARMQAITAFALFLAVVEHSLSIAGTLYYVWPCYDRGGFKFVFQGYFLTKYLKFFTVTTYSAWKALLVLALQFTNVFVWNYLDLFIALFAMGLAARFRQINAELQAATGKEQSDEFWRRKRKQYNALSELVKRVDESIGPIILVSYATDLYFICLQLLSIVNPVEVSKYHEAFFAFSMSYLILRTTFMTYMAANINEESRRPKDVLFSIPTSAYSDEVERFLAQVLTDNVAFTGCNFFSISRSFLLKVAGTIVTYVVVLVQFNGKEINPDSAQSNGTVSCTCEDIKIYTC